MELTQLISDINKIPQSTARTELIKESIRIADQNNENESALYLRRILISDSYYGTYVTIPDALMALSWCISKFGDNEEYSSELVYDYEKVIGMVDMDPTVPRHMFTEMINDFEKRMLQHGDANRFHQNALMIACLMKDPELAKYHYDKLLHKIDSCNDKCKFCTLEEYVAYYMLTGKYEKATKLAMKLYKKTTCYTYVMVANQMVYHSTMRKDFDNAAIHHQYSYKNVITDKAYVGALGNNLLYLASADLKKGMSAYQKYNSWHLNKAIPPFNIFRFSFGAAVLLATAAKQKETSRLKLSTDLPLYNETGVYNLRELAEYHLKLASVQADLFDKRNCNSWFNEQLSIIKNEYFTG